MQRCAPRFETLKGIRKKRTGDSQLATPERLTRLRTELGEITLGLIVAVAVDEQPCALLPDTVGRAPVNCPVRARADRSVGCAGKLRMIEPQPLGAKFCSAAK